LKKFIIIFTIIIRSRITNKKEKEDNNEKGDEEGNEDTEKFGFGKKMK
jgi:hypothetical protein